jgi:dTDP-4-amino-4,6-dideoxygalactose transaminase
MEALRRENIGTGIHFRSLHIQPFYRQKLRIRREDLPNAAAVSDRLLSLPMYPKMTERDVLDVIEAVRKLTARYGRRINGHAPPVRELDLRAAAPVPT